MASKYFKAFNFLKKVSNTSKISPTITQPRQLKKTMEGIRSKFKQFGGTKAKTAVDRANIVRKKKSIGRMLKLESLQKKRKEGIKASKDVKKMVDTGEARKIGGETFHKGVREKKAEGGSISPKDKEKMKEKAKPAADRAFDILRKFKQRPATKQIKGDSGKQKEKPTGKDKPKSIREKIAPKKKMDRLKELKKELG